MSVDVCYHVPLTTPLNDSVKVAFESLLWVCYVVTHCCNVDRGHGTATNFKSDSISFHDAITLISVATSGHYLTHHTYIEVR